MISKKIKILGLIALSFLIYVPFHTENPDGTSNSLYGTAPDIYSRLNVESLEKRRMISKSGEDAYSFENRLEWDNVLADTIEIINND